MCVNRGSVEQTVEYSQNGVLCTCCINERFQYSIISDFQDVLLSENKQKSIEKSVYHITIYPRKEGYIYMNILIFKTFQSTRMNHNQF